MVVKKNERRRTGTGPERGNVTVRPKVTGHGALTKKLLVAPKMRRMTTAGPLSAAEQQLHSSLITSHFPLSSK